MNSIFDSAGKIRELEINSKILDKLPHPPVQLINKIKRRKAQLRERFIHSVSDNIETVHAFRKNINIALKSPDKKTIRHFFKKAILKSEKKLHGFSRNNVHQFRIRIKEIMYVYSALPTKLQDVIRLNKDDFSRQQIKIGQWHDRYAAIRILTHQHLPGKYKKYISILKGQEKREFLSLLIYLQSKR